MRSSIFPQIALRNSNIGRLSPLCPKQKQHHVQVQSCGNTRFDVEDQGRGTLKTQNFEYKLIRSAAVRSTQAVKRERHITSSRIGDIYPSEAPTKKCDARHSKLQRELNHIMSELTAIDTTHPFCIVASMWPESTIYINGVHVIMLRDITVA